jgi:hypothetical protein
VNQLQEQRVRLAMPLNDAIAFAMGVSDLGYKDTEDATRQVIGGHRLAATFRAVARGGSAEIGPAGEMARFFGLVSAHPNPET